MEFASPPPPPPDFQPPAQQPADPSASRRRRLPHAAMVGGLVFGMALGGAGIAFAAGSGSGSGSSTTTPNGAPATPPGPGGHAGHMGGPMKGGPLGELGRFGGKVLYGSATIQTASGATKTIDFQVGTVTATNISGDSGTITVGSGTNNSHTQTYAVQPSTIVDSQAGGISTVKTGDTVIVVAEDNASGNPTAMDIRDRTQMKDSRHGFGFGAPANPNGQSSPNGQNGSTTNPPAGTTSDFFSEVQ